VARCQCLGHQRPAARLDQAHALQLAQHCGAVQSGGSQFGACCRFRLAQEVHQCPRPSRASRQLRLMPRDCELPGALHCEQRFAAAKRCRQGSGQHLADGVVVVVGGPAQQLQQRGLDGRRTVEGAKDGAQPRCTDAATFPAFEDDTDQGPPAERDAHSAARLNGLGVGVQWHAVVEHLTQRRVEADSQNQWAVQSCG